MKTLFFVDERSSFTVAVKAGPKRLLSVSWFKNKLSEKDTKKLLRLLAVYRIYARIKGEPSE